MKPVIVLPANVTSGEAEAVILSVLHDRDRHRWQEKLVRRERKEARKEVAS